MKSMLCTPDNTAEFNAALRLQPDIYDLAKALHRAVLVSGLAGAKLHPAGSEQYGQSVGVSPTLSSAAESRIADLEWQRTQRGAREAWR